MFGASGNAFAFGSETGLDVAELVLSSGTLSRPSAWSRLLLEVRQTTSIEVNPVAVQLSPEDPALFRHPFSVLIVDGEMPVLSEKAVQQLVRYLSYGGFLLVDDTSGVTGGEVEQQVAALCSRLFPSRPLAALAGDHSLFRSFFLLDKPVGRVARSSFLQGVTLGPICPLVYMPNDLSGALERLPDGRNKSPCLPSGESQRREAIKFGVNAMLYALTSNYKHDIAHVVELMREGKLE